MAQKWTPPRHDAACPYEQHLDSHWDPGYHCDDSCANIECLCEFIASVKAAERERLGMSEGAIAVVIDCLASALDWSGAGATTHEQAAQVLAQLDPEHPALQPKRRGSRA